jgi:hypothetical protein
MLMKQNTSGNVRFREKRTLDDHRKSVVPDPTATLAVHCSNGFGYTFSAWVGFRL